MTDDEILGIFERNGMKIELGAQYSVRGQIAQLLNGCKVYAEYVKREASQLVVEADAHRAQDVLVRLAETENERDRLKAILKDPVVRKSLEIIKTLKEAVREKMIEEINQ